MTKVSAVATCLVMNGIPTVLSALIITAVMKASEGQHSYNNIHTAERIFIFPESERTAICDGDEALFSCAMGHSVGSIFDMM